MPYATHTRITLSGIFGTVAGPTEIWACNVHTGPLQATTAANAATVASAVRSAWNINIAPQLNNDITLTRTRVAVIDTTGKVARDFDGSYKQGDDLVTSTSPTAAIAASRLPLQTALVVSTYSARPDATGKGRFFLPWQPSATVGLGADFRLPASTTSAMAQAAKAFLSAVAAAAGAPIVVPSSKGYLSNVTSVRVGRVPDTQRSRRNAAQEGYTVLAYP